MVCEIEREFIKSGESLCVWNKRCVKSVCFYGSRQMYFCGENISIEMQKELAYTPPLTMERRKMVYCSKGLKNM